MPLQPLNATLGFLLMDFVQLARLVQCIHVRRLFVFALFNLSELME